MKDAPAKAREVAGDRVICEGPAQARHAPLRLPLPLEGTARCPVCGSLYRRAKPPTRLVQARWPKQG
ncbi:MAG: hypothetical protein AAGI51_11690 [Pseudomonadota bacterium]